MRWPDCFIVGAPKCGTTTLYEWLAAHPQAYMSDPKEPNFFSTDLSRWCWIRDERRYLELFADARPHHRVVGEASTQYLMSREAVPAILRRCPDARMVVALRDPVAMFLSYHNQALAALLEDRTDPREAWELSARRRRGLDVPPACDEPRLLDYPEVCATGSQLERLLATVPRDRVLVLFLDDIAADPRRTYLRLLRFLGLDDDGRTEFGARNVAYRLRVPWISRLDGVIGRIGRRPDPLGRAVAAAVAAVRPLGRALHRWNRIPAPRREVSPGFLASLREHFLPEVERIEALTGRDLTAWKRGPSQGS